MADFECHILVLKIPMHVVQGGFGLPFRLTFMPCFSPNSTLFIMLQWLIHSPQYSSEKSEGEPAAYSSREHNLETQCTAVFLRSMKRSCDRVDYPQETILLLDLNTE